MAARIIGGVALLALIALGITDYTSDYWVEHPMTAAVISALLVAAVLAALVDTYLKRRETAKWKLVAAIALGEMSHDSHMLRERLLRAVGADPGARADELLAGFDGPAGERLSTAIQQAARDEQTRSKVLEEVVAQLQHAGETMGRWGTIMLQDGDQAVHLNDFTALFARGARLAEVLSAGPGKLDPELDEDWIAGRIAKLIDLALRDEIELMAAGRAIAPKREWMGAPEWLRPVQPGVKNSETPPVRTA
jgi:hypothetical protein